jgi:thiamine-monophosphate kinase
MDVSDGLTGDLANVCRVSAVGAAVAVERVPPSLAARRVLARDPAAIETILTGGDDFEIAAAVPPDRLDGLRAEAAEAGVPIAEVGVVVAGPAEARFVTGDGRVLAFARPGYSHF